MEETITVEETDKNDEKYLAYLVVLVLVGSIALLTYLLAERAPRETVERQSAAAITAFDGISLKAKAAIVWDVKKGRPLFRKNEESQLPLASLTKLMTAIVAGEVAPEGTLVTVSKEDIEVEGDNGLSEGEVWDIDELIGYTLLVSSNDGAHAIANAASAFQNKTSNYDNDVQTQFVTAMNEKAHSIGLVQTYFANTTGLDPGVYTSGSYGSARDVAVLMSYALQTAPELLEATAYQDLTFSSESGELHEGENTNDALDSIPSLIASKTGFTDLAGGNLVVAYDAGLNYPIVVAVLGSTLEGRFSDVEKLVAASLKAL